VRPSAKHCQQLAEALSPTNVESRGYRDTAFVGCPANCRAPTLKGMTAARGPQLGVRRLLIADDRARTRRALRALLATQPGIELIGEAVDGEEAVAEVERLRPDIVILDIRMPRLDGIAATARIKARWPEIKVIAHSLADELAESALVAGADAFVPKGAPADLLLKAL